MTGSWQQVTSLRGPAGPAGEVQTADLTEALESLAAGINGGAPANLDTFVEVATAALAEVARAQAAEALKVNKAGDTMTGPLTLAADPTNALHAATKQWVTAQVAALTTGSPAELDTFLEAFQHWQGTESEVGTLTALVNGKQASDATLTALSGLATTTLGRSLLTVADHAALVAVLALTPTDVGLGNVANKTPAQLAADAAFTGSYAPAQDTMVQTRLERQTTDANRFLSGRARQRGDDALAAAFTETWANTTAWTGLLNVTTGSNAAYGATAAEWIAQRAISVPTGGRFVARAILHLGSAANRSAYLTVNNDTAGGAPTPGIPNGFGVGVGVSAGGVAQIAGFKGGNVGSSGYESGGPFTATLNTDYVATIVIDENDVCATIQTLGGAYLLVVRVPRANFPGGPVINNLAVSGTDNSAAGSSAGPIFTCPEILVPIAAAHRTVGGKALFTTACPLVFKVRAAGSATGWWFNIPGNYDYRVPTPLVQYEHGAGGSGIVLWTNATRETNVMNTLAAAGYIVFSSDNGPSGSTDRFGNQAGVDDYVAECRYARQHFNPGPLFLWVVSMGGETAEAILAQRALGGIAAVALLCPGLDLAAVEQNATYTAAVRTAWGAADHASFVTAIAGKNPIDFTANQLRDTPQRFYVSSDDAVAPPATHAYPLRDRLLAAGAPVSTVVVTGVHVPVAAFQPSDLLAFFEQYRYAA